MLKICGLNSRKQVELCERLGVDLVGIVFHESSARNVPVKDLASILCTEKKACTVAVTVNANNTLLDSIFAEHQFDYIQVHGHETVNRIKEIKNRYNTGIIRSFAVHSHIPRDYKKYEEVIDFFLFDTANHKNNLYGGSGKSFDWNITKQIDTKKEWFLAGGLHAGNIKDAMKFASNFDISSGLELERGKKSERLIIEFSNKFNALKSKKCY